MKLNHKDIKLLITARDYLYKLKSIINGGSSDALEDDPLHQHAIIFCFKAVGNYIDRLAESKGVDLSKRQPPPDIDTLLFWQNMHVMRNRLVHHVDSFMTENCLKLSKKALSLIVIIANQVDYIINYFQGLIDFKDTHFSKAFSKKNNFFRVFQNFLLFTKDCVDKREDREKIEPRSYAQALVNAVTLIEHCLPNPLTVENIDQMRVKQPQHYLAVQNLLECIATYTNPRHQSRIEKELLGPIRMIDQALGKGLRELGQLRNTAEHNNAEVGIANKDLLVVISKTLLPLKACLLAKLDWGLVEEDVLAIVEEKALVQVQPHAVAGAWGKQSGAVLFSPATESVVVKGEFTQTPHRPEPAAASSAPAARGAWGKGNAARVLFDTSPKKEDNPGESCSRGLPKKGGN